MRSKVLLVVLALVAAGAVGWLLLGRDGVAELFSPAREDAGDDGRDGIDASVSAADGDGTSIDAASPRGPILEHGRAFARIGKGGLVGRALDVRTAKGLAKAVVTLGGTGLGQEAVARTAETDADGSFRFLDVAAGLDYALRVEAKGLVSLDLRRVVVTADAVKDLGDLWLGLPGALEGFVIDVAGEGVVGADVQLHRGIGSLREFLASGGFVDLFVNLDREPEPLVRTTTKAKGAFRIEGAPAGPLALVVRAPGYKQAIVPLTLTSDAGRGPVTVRLLPGATLAGKVVDAQGQGVGDVQLAAYMQDGSISPLSRTFTRSAADGAFRFASLAGEGKQVIVGSRAGYPNVFAPAEAGDMDVRLVLRGGATLDVHVVNDADGAPVAGAQVLVGIGERADMADIPGTLVGALTDASGAALLEVIPGEIQLAIVSAPGYPPSFWQGQRGIEMFGGMKGPDSATVPEGRSTVTFRLPLGVKLTGKVTDLEGRPLAGVEVTSMGFMGQGDKTISGADGSYELHLVSTEMMMGVLARLPGWVQDRAQQPEMVEEGAPAAVGKPVAMDIRMRRAVMVAGRVLDPAGRPVAGATVTVHRVRDEKGFSFDMSGMLGGNPSSITLANGTYAVDGVASEGKARVVAHREGYVDGGTKPFEVGKELARAPDVHLLPGASLTVKVLGPDGKAVPGARVHVRVRRTDEVQSHGWEAMVERQSGQNDHRTGAGGTADLTLLPPGEVTVRVKAEGFASMGVQFTLAPGATFREPLPVRLKPGIVVAGRVVDGDGQPLEGVVVRVEKLEGILHVSAPGEGGGRPTGSESWGSARHEAHRVVSDAQGRWSVKDLPDRPLEVRASKDGYRGFEGTVGEDRARVEIRLVKRDPETVKRLKEIDKELQALYQQFGAGDAEARQALMQKLNALQEEKKRLGAND